MTDHRSCYTQLVAVVRLQPGKKQNKTKQQQQKKKTDLDGIITQQRYSALPAELLSLQKADHILSSYYTRGG